MHIGVLANAARNVRYVEFSPPIVHPQQDHVTVQARQNTTLSCEGHKPVTWHLPQDMNNKDISDRVSIMHASDPNSKNRYISNLLIRHMVYTDTGSYVCSFNGSKDLRSIDSNTGIHIYVFDEIHLLTHSGFDFQQSVQYETAEIPCTPTHPNVTVSLSLQGRGPVNVDNKYITFSPKVGFLISPVLPEHSGQYWCMAKYAGKTSEYGVSLNVLMQTSYVPPPHINRTSGSHVTVGETLILTCSISVNWNVMVSLSWNLPNKRARQPRLLLPDPISRNVSIGGSHLKVVEQKLKLHKVDKEDQGNYACVVTDHSNNQQTRREFIRIYDRDQSFLRVWQDGYSTFHKSSGKDDSVQWVVEIASHPPPRVTWYDPDGNVIKEGEDNLRGRIVQTAFAKTTRSMLKLTHLKLEDTGDYSIKVENDFHVKWENFTLEVTDKPTVKVSVLEPSDNGLYQLGSHYTFQCTATGYPPPKITWTFKRCKTYNKCEEHKEHYGSTIEAPNGRFQMDATLKAVAKDSGVFTCMGCNGDGNCEISQINFFVTTLPEGFHITGPTRAIEGDSVDLVCAASKYNYTDNSLVWYKQSTSGYKEVTTIKDAKHRRGRKNGGNAFKNNLTPSIQVFDDTPSKFDIGKRLRFQSIEPHDSGVYVCQAKIQGPKRRHNMDSSTIVERQMELKVQGLKAPKFFDTMNMNKDPIFIRDEGESVEMRCKVKGYPLPKVEWFLNDTAIDFKNHPNFLTFDDGQSLRIAAVVAKKNEGKYTCKASSRAGKTQLDQLIIKVEAPEIFKTDMFGSNQMIDNMVDKVIDSDSVMNLTCQATGKPRPTVYWMFNNLPVNESYVKYVNHNQTMIIEHFSSKHEGKYDCIVSNLGGTITRYQWVKLRETEQHASIYGADIAIPVFIAVGAVLILAIILVAIAKICLTTGRWKAPPTPPTPRLTQFDLPEEDHETESCRLTLSRDGSPYGQAVCQGCNGCAGNCHQCSSCHYNFNGLYGCSNGGGMVNGLPGPMHGGSIIGVRGCHTPVQSHVPSIPSPNSQLMSEFTNYGQNTLPAHRMDTLRREMTIQYKDSRRSASPRLSAEF